MPSLREREGCRAELVRVVNLGVPSEVKQILEEKRYRDVVNNGDMDQRYAVHVAAENGYLEILQLLVLKGGARIDVKDQWGVTPWHGATKFGKVAVAKWLLSQGFDPPEEESNVSKGFVATFLFFEIVVVILYGLFTDYDKYTVGGTSYADEEADMTMERLYPLFQDVHVMIFIGFGFLMTFMRRYMLGAVSFTLLIAAFTVQWSILTNGFFHRAIGDYVWSKPIQLNVQTLITGDFAAGAVLISYGALIGKVSPLQMIFLAFLECLFYSVNESIGAGTLVAVDMGGSMFVHLFGALFGCTASYVMTDREAMKQKAMHHPHILTGASYHSDTFAMIGTVYLWMFWPSFNGALAVGTARQRVVINTVLALTASATNGFLFSHLFNKGKFNMVDVQNATLAGGVAVGSSCDMVVGAWPALLIGTIAGIASTAGFNKLQGFLEEKLDLHDTCGVLNLHGIPGFLGAIAGCFSAATATDTVFGQDISSVFPGRGPPKNYSATDQGWIQFITLMITIGMSVSGGFVSALVVREFSPRLLFPPNEKIYRDTKYIHVEDPDRHPLGEAFCESEDMLKPPPEHESVLTLDTDTNGNEPRPEQIGNHSADTTSQEEFKV